MADQDLVWKSAAELARLIAAREVSPVEVVQAYLDRIEALDGTLHAFITITADAARAAARAAEAQVASGDARGPLGGVPIALKDLVSTRGVRTTGGSRILADNEPAEDATVATRLAAAGAISLGKLNMHEFAYGPEGLNPHYGTPWNPWDAATHRMCGGSSSGSGAAVAAALVPFALGSETWGSIICPSSFCGISGLRPTFGRVSRQGAMALSWTLDKLGPMGRTAEDCETVYRVLAGPDPDDPYSSREPLGPPSDPAAARRLRVAWLKLDFEKAGDKKVGAVFDRAIADLAARGIRAEEAKLPDLPFEATTAIVLYAEVSTAYEELERTGKVRDLVSPGAPRAFVVSRAIRGADFVKAQRVRTLCQKAMAEFFSRYDVLLYPGETHTAFGAEQDFSEIPWADPAGGAGNLCGLPAISVPCGFAEDGLPVSLTAMSGAFEESKALSVARFYQSITSWHQKRPPLSPAA